MRTVIKNIVLLTVLTVLCTVAAGAQGKTRQQTKMSPWLQSKYRLQQEKVKQNGGPLRVKGRPVMNYVLTLVQSTDEAATVCEKGGVVWQVFGQGICAAFLPLDSLGVLDQSAAILCMEANQPSQLMNDTSAVIIGVDKILTPDSSPLTPQLPQAFTGKGIIAGVMDISFDFTHPAFRHADGTSRIKWFWDPAAKSSDPEAFGAVYDSPDAVLAAQCSADAFSYAPHGTHVMGSMAGGGLAGRYVGMAPDADIMGVHTLLGAQENQETTIRFGDYVKSHLEDWAGVEDVIFEVDISSVQFLVGLKRLFDAADAAGKPCVVNWSFGGGYNFEGDWTLFEVVLNQMLGPGRIVMVAAGNTGHLKTFVHKEANEPMKQEIFFNGPEKDPSHNYRYTMEIRAKTEEEVFFDMTLDFEGLQEPIAIDTREAFELADPQTRTYSIERPELRVSVQPTLFAGGCYGFNLIVEPNSEVHTHPEKMVGTLTIDTPVALDFCAIAWADNVTFDPKTIDQTRGCNIHTIGYPASLERVITVGAMHHRTSFTNILGEPATYKKLGSEEGHLAAFSSCGPGATELIKPDVVAPGHNICSAMSTFYVKDGSEEATKEEVEPKTIMKANVFGKDYAVWAMSGTSMATPITSGVVALWLQAKPDLTPEDIKGVIQRTSHQPEPEFSGTDKNIYYGWGEIDAYAGLLDILDIATTIPQLSRHQPAGVTFRLTGHTLYINGIESSTVPVTVYDLTGRPVLQTVSGDGALYLPNLPAGVYAVQLGNQGSTLIRL